MLLRGSRCTRSSRSHLLEIGGSAESRPVDTSVVRALFGEGESFLLQYDNLPDVAFGWCVSDPHQ